MKSENYKGREQTEVKHRALERYLSGFVPIVGRWADEIVYVDCLAGPWEAVDPDLEDTSFCRALNVLRTTRRQLLSEGYQPRFRCLFIERNEESFGKLERFCSGISDIEVVAKHWDFTEHVQDVLDFVGSSSKTFPFFFIDPTGWEPIAVPVLAPIFQRRPAEVLINLMTSWMKWLLADESKQFHNILQADVRPILNLHGDEREEELVRVYCDSLRRWFEYVCPLPVLKAEQDAIHYFLVYGTHHPKGVEVFKSTEKAIVPFMHETRAESQSRRELDRSNQFGLFGATENYVERRYSRLREKNSNEASQMIKCKLAQGKSINYDELWSLAMQFSAVSEDDLRGWLSHWQAQGMIEWQGKGERQRVPQRRMGNSFIWTANN